MLPGAVLVVAACTSSQPSSPPSSQPSNASSPTPMETAWPERPWVAVGSGRIGGTLIRGISATDGTVVVVGVGSVGGASDGTGALLYTSTDGGAWTEGRVAGGISTGWVEDVVAYDGGFVAVGWDACKGLPWISLDYTGCRPIVWSSADGVEWDRFDELPYPDAGLTAIIPWHGGLLAALSRGPVLRSGDGRTWQPIDASPAAAAVTLGLAADDESVIAVGTCVQGPASPCHALVNAWVSSDGATWSEPEALPTPDDFGPIMLDVARTSSGYVAIATGSRNSAAWLRGTDGWKPLAPFGEREGVALFGIAASPAGALVIGYQGAGGGRAVLFGSRDGASWLEMVPNLVVDATSVTPGSVTWGGDSFIVGLTHAGMNEVLEGLPHLPTPAEVAVATPFPTLPPQVLYQARAVTSARISGIDGLEPKAGIGTCLSRFAEQSLGQLTANHLGEVRGGSLQANFELNASPAVGSSVEIRFNLEGAELAPGSSVPSWFGEGLLSEVSADGTSGSITFTDLPSFFPAGTSDAWPTTISGSLSWTCRPWEDPDATMPPARAGSATATIADPGWVAERGDAMCSLEIGGALSQLTGTVGRLDGSGIGANLSLTSGLRVAEPWVRQQVQLWLSVRDEPMIYWVGSATILELSADGLSGRAGFTNLARENDAPGWPAALSGEVSWDCR